MNIDKTVSETRTFNYSFKLGEAPDERAFTFAINADTKAEANAKLAGDLEAIAAHLRNDPKAKSQ